MLAALRRHQLPLATRFRQSLVLTYALPREAVERVLPPALVAETEGEAAFGAVALVACERLRPAFLPPALGLDVAFAGHRLFVRVRAKPSLRGLYVLRTYVDRRALVPAGAVLTHYGFRHARVALEERGAGLDVEVRTSDGAGDLAATMRAETPPAPPPGSPFADWAAARRYHGPLPYTFDVERDGRVAAVRAQRHDWEPRPVAVDVHEDAFFRGGPFAGCEPVLAGAFHVARVDYRWERGRLV
jgi:hypothetical protein